MDMHGRSIRPSDRQKRELLSQIELDIEMVRNRSSDPDGYVIQQRKWTDLTETLNDMGGACKDPRQWRKCWTDYCTGVMKRFRKINAHLKNQGIEGNPLDHLEDFDQRTIAIIRAVQANDNRSIIIDQLLNNSDPLKIEEHFTSTSSNDSASPPASSGTKCDPDYSPPGSPQETLPRSIVISQPARKNPIVPPPAKKEATSCAPLNRKRPRNEDDEDYYLEQLAQLAKYKKISIEIKREELELLKAADKRSQEMHELNVELLRLQIRALQKELYKK